MRECQRMLSSILKHNEEVNSGLRPPTGQDVDSGVITGVASRPRSPFFAAASTIEPRSGPQPSSAPIPADRPNDSHEPTSPHDPGHTSHLWNIVVPDSNPVAVHDHSFITFGLATNTAPRPSGARATGASFSCSNNTGASQYPRGAYMPPQGEAGRRPDYQPARISQPEEVLGKVVKEGTGKRKVKAQAGGHWQKRTEKTLPLVNNDVTGGRIDHPNHYHHHHASELPLLDGPSFASLKHAHPSRSARSPPPVSPQLPDSRGPSQLQGEVRKRIRASTIQFIKHRTDEIIKHGRGGDASGKRIGAALEKGGEGGEGNNGRSDHTGCDFAFALAKSEAKAVLGEKMNESGTETEQSRPSIRGDGSDSAPRGSGGPVTILRHPVATNGGEHEYPHHHPAALHGRDNGRSSCSGGSVQTRAPAAAIWAGHSHAAAVNGGIGGNPSFPVWAPGAPPRHLDRQQQLRRILQRSQQQLQQLLQEHERQERQRQRQRWRQQQQQLQLRHISLRSRHYRCLRNHSQNQNQNQNRQSSSMPASAHSQHAALGHPPPLAGPPSPPSPSTTSPPAPPAALLQSGLWPPRPRPRTNRNSNSGSLTVRPATRLRTASLLRDSRPDAGDSGDFGAVGDGRPRPGNSSSSGGGGGHRG